MKINWYHIPLISNKFRIREITMGDDKSKFFPQVRFLFVWRNVRDSSYDINGVANFKQLSAAEEYLFKMTMKHRASQIKKMQSHPFDPVFHKLKQNGNRNQDGETQRG